MSGATAANADPAELIERTAAGDRDVFSDLYGATCRRTYGLTLHVTGLLHGRRGRGSVAEGSGPATAERAAGPREVLGLLGVPVEARTALGPHLASALEKTR